MSFGLNMIIAEMLVFTLYVVLVRSTFGTLSSISASSYKWEGNARYIFTFWLYSLAVMNLFHYEVMGVFAGLTSIGLAIAGTTIDHKQSKDLEDEIHTWGTIIAVVSGFTGQIIYFGMIVPLVACIAIGLLLLLFARNWIWYAEILATLTLGWGFIEIYHSLLL